MTERPLSPHLQVYRPQLTSAMSISHRATGIFLALGIVLVIYWLHALASGAERYDEARALLLSVPGRLLLLALAGSIYYHLLNGLRHLLWDAGWALDLPGAYRTGWIVLALTVLASALTAVWIFGGGA